MSSPARNLTSATLHAVAQQIAGQTISLATMMVMFRFVDQAEFGLFAMVLPIVMLPRSFTIDSLYVATVQRRDIPLPQIFVWQTVLGVGVAAFSSLLTLAAMWFYNTTDILWVGLAMCATTLFAGISSAALAHWQRELQIQRFASVKVFCQLCGAAVGVTVAVNGGQVWALVSQQVVEYGLIALHGVTFVPSLRASQRNQDAENYWKIQLFPKQLIQFTSYYSLSSAVFSFAQQLDTIVLAYVLGGSPGGREAVGLYSQMKFLVMKPVMVVSTAVSNVLLPVVSRYWQRAGGSEFPDSTELATTIRPFFTLASLVLFPTAGLLAGVATEVIGEFAGDKWLPAVPILIELCPMIATFGLLNLCGSVYAGTNRTKQLFAASFLWLGYATIAVTAGMSVPWLSGSVHSIASAEDALVIATQVAGWMGIGSVPFALIYLAVALRLNDVDWRPLLPPQLWVLLKSIAMTVIVAGLEWLLFTLGWDLLLRLLIPVITDLIIYAMLCTGQLRRIWDQLEDTGASVAKVV